MQSAQERNLDIMPVGKLGIVALSSCEQLGKKINDHILSWRKDRDHVHAASPHLYGYDQDTFLIPIKTPRFGSGEAKGQVFSSVRGDDIYILVDVCNYSITYTMNGIVNHMSPDDHFQDLKRIIAAIGGKARRITVIMPYLYESRQNKRGKRESLDCAMALQELIAMGVDSIITFDAHDPRVQNAIPLHGFETYNATYQFIKGIYKSTPDFIPDAEHLMIISPDEAGMKRAIYMANVLGVDMGMFFKRKDYTHFINGTNPTLGLVFLGESVEGKDVVIMDDMISSGETVLEVAYALKKRKAKRVFICATFGVFTRGFQKFDQAYAGGILHRLLSTNLVWHPPELLSKPWYTGCDLSKFLSLIIDTMNHDGSVSDLLDPFDRIDNYLTKQGVRKELKEGDTKKTEA